MKDRKKKSWIFLVVFMVLVILVVVGLRWYFSNMNFNEGEQVNKTTEEIVKEVEKDAIIEKDNSNEEIGKENSEEDENLSDDVLIKENSITLDEIFKDATNHKSKKDKVLEDENCLTDTNLNINGKGLGEEIDKNTINDIYLTNKNDTINDKDMEKSNKVKSEENRSDRNENKVEDNTPSFDAEPEQKNPIIWEDGGEPMKKGEQQNANSGPTDGISTNGGYLN